MATFSKVFSCPSEPRATGGTIRPCYSKVFSCRAAIQRRYSGISSPPSPPPGLLLPVEELKSRHGFGPWLMFADAKNDKRDPADGGFRRCYSFSSGEVFSLPAPQLQGRRCWGTQYGWLITFGPRGVMDLFNPLTHHQLPLPSKRTFKGLRTLELVHDDRTAFFGNFSLSSNPSDSDPLVVMSTYGYCRQLSFSSPGDKAWKYLKDDPEFNTTANNDDTIFYRGQFYSIDCMGKLKACDITSGEIKEKIITTFTGTPDNMFYLLYLVEISGHLHLICQTSSYDPFIKIKNFYIYRFDFHRTEWISIEDLNGHTLFVGNNSTFAISATDYPEIKPNCIYYTHNYSQDYKYSFCEMGVYDFATKTVVKVFRDDFPISRFSRPFFFIPSVSDL